MDVRCGQSSEISQWYLMARSRTGSYVSVNNGQSGEILQFSLRPIRSALQRMSERRITGVWRRGRNGPGWGIGYFILKCRLLLTFYNLFENLSVCYRIFETYLQVSYMFMISISVSESLKLHHFSLDFQFVFCTPKTPLWVLRAEPPRFQSSPNSNPTFTPYNCQVGMAHDHRDHHPIIVRVWLSQSPLTISLRRLP